jgi:hypothetical protein
MSETSLIIPGENTLGPARQNFREQLDVAAEAQIEQLQEEGYQPLEIRAILQVEKLRMLGGFELVTLMERGALFREIEQEGLVSVYPGDYQSLEEIVQAIGISKSMYSDTRGLCDIVFPWLEENTERPLQEWWEDIGISKFRELLPVLRGLIEGESARNHETVNEAIRAQLDNAVANIVTEAANDAGRQLEADEIETLAAASMQNGTAQRRAILNVLELGNLPVREMRQQVRPSRTPNIAATILRGQTSYAVLRMNDDDQIEMLQRLMGTHMDAATVDAADFASQTRLLGEIVPE